MSDEGKVQGVSQATTKHVQDIRAAQRAALIEIAQIESEEELTEWGEEAAFLRFRALDEFKTIEKRITRKNEKEETSETQKVEEIIESVDANASVAEDYQHRNAELNARALLSLRQGISEDDTVENILEKLLKSYPDQYLADEAVDFLLEITNPHTKLGKNLRLAKNLLNEIYQREIRAGRNINNEAQAFSKEGLGSAGSLRDLYRDITGNPRTPLVLFEELKENFTFERMKTVIKFVLHSIGVDLKSKGPSIDPRELQRLFSEARSMQAILGVFRFFFERMNLISGQFSKEDLDLPTRLSFELLAKTFMKLIAEKYPSPEKILRLAVMLGVSEDLVAQVILFTQFRDGLRGVSPRLFRSNRHRQDLLMNLIETLSELEDLLEEEEDEEEEEEEEPPIKKGWDSKDTLE